jgi:hypothetical protein
VYPLKLNEIAVFEQKSPDGDGVGVTPTLVKSKLTSSQGILGVGVGIGSQSQSKYALKSKVVQSTGNGVGEGHIPIVKSFAEISGHTDLHGVAPCKIQTPPKLLLKHQYEPV